MNEQQVFLDAAKKYEAIVEDLKKAREELDAAMLTLGLDTYVQDPITMAVYKICKPTGAWTYYHDLDYKRTALEGERGGIVLSKTEASNAGFILKK
jgi:hypothetical protein